MSLDADQLYGLFPAIYRTRDAENGNPLQALLSVIAGQATLLEENIRQLYDDQFIETCAEWVIPYIGDLVASNSIYEIGAARFTRRAEVANTIGYRRRKGTLLALEQVAMDVSGRPAAAVEFFKRLITTQSMHHLRPYHVATVNLHAGARLTLINTAFDTLNRTVEVRRIGPRVRALSDPDPAPLAINLHGGGKFNIPDVALYLWRWKSNPVLNSPAFEVDSRRYMFSPLGQNIPLFNQPYVRDSFSRLTTRMDVPQPIGRREFFEKPTDFYGPGNSIQLIADGVPIDVSLICCRDLSDQAGGQWGCTLPGTIAIDPALGRIQMASGVAVPRQLRVSYSYGFPAEIGGGPYNRSANLPALVPAAFQFYSVVGSAAAPTLEQAIAAWNSLPPRSTGLIVLSDFEVFDADLTSSAAVILPSGSTLWIISAQPDSIPGLSGSRATVRGQIEIRGRQAPDDPGRLFVNGIWISGSVRIDGDVTVQFSDCTLVPGIALARNALPVTPGEPSIIADSAGVSLSLLRCISGPIGVTAGATTRICSSIVDSSSRCAVAYAGPDLASEGADLHVEDSTVIGKVWVRTMELASNTAFLARRPRHDPWAAALWCGRKQAGCLRFCFVPADSITPRRFRCLPGDPAEESALQPHFVTLRYGHPSYALLSGDVPMAVWTGADNGSQIGVYKSLEETEAVRNVQLRTPEFLPFNLEAGVFLEPSAAVVIHAPPFRYGYGLLRTFDPCAEPTEDELLHIGLGAHLI
jgi:hypothetical protein